MENIFDEIYDEYFEDIEEMIPEDEEKDDWVITVI